MNSLQHFLAMGGYAAYVWPAYAIAVAVLSGNVIFAMREKRQRIKQLKKRWRIEQKNDAS